MANGQGNEFRIRLTVPDDPLDTDEGVEIEVSSARDGVRRRVYTGGGQTRVQLVTAALTALRVYVLAQGQG